jgi:peroxiredoxin
MENTSPFCKDLSMNTRRFWIAFGSLILLALPVPFQTAAPAADNPAPDAPAASAPAASATHPAVGDKAKDFSLKTLDGKEIKLSELLKTGPVVVVQLRGWVGYQCPICQRQTGELIAHAKDFAAAGAKVVFIYPGPNDNLKEHAAEFTNAVPGAKPPPAGTGFPEGFSFVLDPGLKFVNAWNLRWDKKGETAYPSTFIVSKEGTITYAKISKSHGDRATSADILKSLAGKP